MIDHSKFTIGDTTISVERDFQPKALEIPAPYRRFIENGKTDITLRMHEEVLAPAIGEKKFECPPVWSLYRHDGISAIRIYEHMPGLGRTLILPQEIKNTDLYFDDPAGSYRDPFYGPTMELLMVNYLAHDLGAIIHGCGIKQDNCGIIFVGESGAGKTTMANIWNEDSKVEILSDDRTIVRKQGDHFVMYGTPWHGEGKFGSPASARLEQIFFIQHGQTNSISKSTQAQSVTQFLKCAFPPFWDAAGMEYSMDVFSDLSASVSCRMLSFKADSSIVDFVNKLI